MEDILTRALASFQQGQRFAFATVIDSTPKGTPRKPGAKMVVFEDGSSWGTIGGGRNEKAAIGESLKSIKDLKPRTCTYDYFGKEGGSVCGGRMTVFIEPVTPPINLLICGGGHIALPLSWMAKVLGFHVTIIDNRKPFASKARFPHVDKIVYAEYLKALKNFQLTNNHYVVIVTQGNEHDYECLRGVAASAAGYIGVISSKAKKVKFTKRLHDEGFTQGQVKRVHIPMGLDLGGQTPAEIAVSICAQLVATKNKALIGSAKFKGGQ